MAEGPNQLSVHWAPAALSPGINKAGYRIDHSSVQAIPGLESPGADQEQPGGELLKKRPEKQERSGEMSRARLGTESVGDASWKPCAPKWSKRN
jgi:hypothetical protein